MRPLITHNITHNTPIPPPTNPHTHPRVQNAYRHLGAARLELDLYRRQRLLPAEPFRLLTVLERSVVSTRWVQTIKQVSA